jgi:serine protease Do
LALLSAPGLEAPPAVLGDSDALQVGTPVLAVGNPLGFSGAVSSGIIHSLGPFRGISALPWVQADIRLAPGNSGGPLADFRGQVVGINTMVVSGGLALAIPSRAVHSFLSSKNSPVSLGVVVRPMRLRKGQMGMMILELVSGGAAEAASLMPGDILIGASGSPFNYVEDLQLAIDNASASLLQLDFYRAGQETTRRVTVQLLPDRIPNAA